MFKAKFVNYKTPASGYIGIFTPGREYKLDVIENDRYYRTYDDYGVEVKFNSLFLDNYVFERVSDSELFDMIEEPASLKYYINGNLVQKSYFYELIGELNEADRLGAKVSSVKFEIKFE
ncbi:hypothetical protein OPT79_2 [Klebsiella phage vB_KpnD_Opt-79]|uniref:Uncharacterized protein n=1 Tax=Escherichia phage vB_EcoD_Sadiya TaxID=2902684 RepID=A0AC61TRE9_9CAUD|nr:hypothetical protein OPT719_4 [Escherichia phage vB_EcoD_Opt-719]UGO52779.1 hypothetical protein OPT79_2 [Klebsiella phage vB_KpnD_Opt-79]UGV22526.1 hypothetical protein PHLEASOLO_4 [Escherichia phage vB_ EcoD_Phleasolo]UGV22695.1 hypothetical protein SADIYA_4 [Escherichia phage vB_EcoD_Sadiya]